MSETFRQFKAEVAQRGLTLVEKESAWRNFLRTLIRKRETARREHARIKEVADKFENHGRPMGGALDD